jgi:hypothetical protein
MYLQKLHIPSPNVQHAPIFFDHGVTPFAAHLFTYQTGNAAQSTKETLNSDTHNLNNTEAKRALT